MRKNAQNVIEAFLSGKAKAEKTISTNGRVLYSYAMPIAVRIDGHYYVVAYSDAPTATTRSHVRATQVSVPSDQTSTVDAASMRDLASDYHRHASR
jgi:hypothetical protein